MYPQTYTTYTTGLATAGQLAVGKVAALKKWKGKMLSENPPKEEFDKVLHETLVYATAVFGIIRPAHQQCYR